ncbi:MAG: hypothetical protein AAFO87_04045 [Cyanobacteria bacterium J06607_6]
MGWGQARKPTQQGFLALSRTEESDRLVLTHSDIPLLPPSQRLLFDGHPGRSFTRIAVTGREQTK